MLTSDKPLIHDHRTVAPKSALPSRRARVGLARTSVTCSAWCLVGLLTAITACSESSGSGDSGQGGTKAKGGAAGAASTGGAASTSGGATAVGGGGASGSTAIAGATSSGGSGGCPALPSSSAGQAGAPTPVCVMPAKWGGKIKPVPLVSVGKPVFTNSTDQTNKGLIVDGKYHVTNGLVFNPTATSATWASINVGSGYSKLLLQWQDVGYQDYGPSLYSATDYKSATSPTGYSIKTSSDSTNGDDGTWTTVATVTGNEARGRSHLVPFQGMSWVRFEVTAAPEVAAGTMRAVRIDEIELHDYSSIVDGDLADSWLVMGDSITKMSFDRNRGANELDELITAQRASYQPAIIAAGIGGEKLADALRHLKTEKWLEYSEGVSFVTLAYGTNDSWGSATAAGAGFEMVMRDVIKVLLDAKRVPVLARIPWNTVGANLSQFNAVIDKLQQEFELPCGPDLFGLVASHPEYVRGNASVQPDCTVKYSGDGVHPQSSAAKNAIHAEYAAALLPLYGSQP